MIRIACAMVIAADREKQEKDAEAARNKGRRR